jgi:hypothetical protein
MSSVIKFFIFFLLISQSIYSQDSTRILSHVIGPVGVQSLKRPDLDLVHGVLSSNRLTDDFEKRVTDELNRLNMKGHRTDVENIYVRTYVSGNKIITESSCDIVESRDGRSYVVFTTRGSIGRGYKKRHDKQIQGLESWLSFYYRGYCKKVKTILVTFKLRGGVISYKQSFFVVARGY